MSLQVFGCIVGSVGWDGVRHGVGMFLFLSHDQSIGLGINTQVEKKQEKEKKREVTEHTTKERSKQFSPKKGEDPRNAAGRTQKKRKEKVLPVSAQENLRVLQSELTLANSIGLKHNYKYNYNLLK